MDKREALWTVEKLVCSEREGDYGSPAENFQATANMWSTYLGHKMDAHDVAVLLILMKISRLRTSPTKQDHWLDIAGYAIVGFDALSEILSEGLVEIKPRASKDFDGSEKKEREIEPERSEEEGNSPEVHKERINNLRNLCSLVLEISRIEKGHAWYSSSLQHRAKSLVSNTKDMNFFLTADLEWLDECVSFLRECKDTSPAGGYLHTKSSSLLNKITGEDT